MFYVNATEIAAECKGDSGELYRLGWKDGRWTCSCKARVDCSHLGALWSVTAVARELSEGVNDERTSRRHSQPC